ncbi:hypothetical protein OENI_1380002 [Oenococcus oeni]|nr:hypothetical protein OENI_1380002 [Oenococcus oeni]
MIALALADAGVLPTKIGKTKPVNKANPNTNKKYFFLISVFINKTPILNFPAKNRSKIKAL